MHHIAGGNQHAKGEITSYTYDTNGNMLTQTDGKGNVTSFEYNAANKPVKRIDHVGRLGSPGNYTYLEAKTETYTYYGDGSLNSKTDRNGKTTNYAYDIYGRLTNGNMVSKSKSVTRPADQYESVSFSVYKAGESNVTKDVTFYEYNVWNQLVKTIEGDKTVTSKYNADGYRVEKTYRYAGYQFDDETGLYYLNARYYDSKIARFLTEDTYRGQANDSLSLNLYTYCLNNPIMYFDPTGHLSEIAEKVIKLFNDIINNPSSSQLQIDSAKQNIQNVLDNDAAGRLSNPKKASDLPRKIISDVAKANSRSNIPV